MGLAVLIHTSLYPFSKRKKDLEPDLIECLWLEIKTHKTSAPVLIGNLYKNSAYGDEWDECFMDMMFKVCSKYKHVVLLGDFNIHLELPHPKWSSITSMLNLTQFVNLPTRVDPISECESIIDQIYSNDITNLKNTRVIDSNISDHKSIFCVWSFSGKPLTSTKACHTTIEYRYLKNFESLRFTHDLSLVPFHLVYKKIDGENALDLLTNILCSVIDKHAPIKQKRVKHPSLPPWLNDEIIKAMAERDSFKKDKKLVEYRSQRNKVNKLVRQAKKKYFNKLIEESKSIKTVWSAINEILNKSKNKSSSPASYFEPEEFNNFFLSISDSSLSEEASQSDNFDDTVLKAYCKSKLSPDKTFSIPPLSVIDVGKYIESLENKKSMGPDKVSPYFLKLALPYILEPLIYAYNLYISQKMFPSSLKTAKVIPLPKGGQCKNLGDVRPISFLPILAKPIKQSRSKKPSSIYGREYSFS